MKLQPLQPGRIACCVPFCGRTYKVELGEEPREAMCGRHWRLAPKKLRRAHGIALRRMKALDRAGDPLDPGDLDKMEHLYAVAMLIWDRIKARAIEAAGGL